MSEACRFCKGEGLVWNTYFGSYGRTCPRCDGDGIEPAAEVIHAGMLLRNLRSRKVWAVFGEYPSDWGLHRMKLGTSGGHYVWQIIHRPAAHLIESSERWTLVGFGTAWDHDLMESDPPYANRTQTLISAAEPENTKSR